MIPSLTDFPALLRPMTQEESEIFIRTLLAEQHKALPDVVDLSHPERTFPGLKEVPFGMGVFCKRLEVYSPGCRVSASAAMFMVFLCKNPAMAVMWAYTSHRMFQRRGDVGLKLFADQFPMGIPTEDCYREAWKAQKRVDQPPPGAMGMLRSDNLLDTPEGWAEVAAATEPAERPRPKLWADQANEEHGSARKFDLSS